ncbi:hypothetical protein [Dyella sp. 20L07]|uniref:hypothetical protein n=1 Tax=Dyella sp. 20L07 TaxID=3384240 RepID=UPI003D27406E
MLYALDGERANGSLISAYNNGWNACIAAQARAEQVEHRLHIGQADNGKAVLTIMAPGED